jgi:hypothetical protein
VLGRALEGSMAHHRVVPTRLKASRHRPAPGTM